MAVFASAVFDADILTTIWVTGIVVLIVSLISGAWGVVASDFIQTLVVAIISIACVIVGLVAVGGPGKIITEFPSGFFVGPDMNYPILIVCFFIFYFVKQLQSINNMQDSYRYLTAKDSKNASKAALMAGIMMLIGSVIWFIPAWSTAILYPQAASEYAALGAKASDAVYLVFAREFMPVGTIGLLMAGLFAATMSSMDSALNRNSGIFVKSFYSTIVRKGQASDKEQLRVGQFVCIINGFLVILSAQFFTTLKDTSLFDLMMQVATLIQGPILVPLCFGIFIKRTPNWAPWATVVFGGFVSWSIINIFTPGVIAGWFGIDQITGREASDIRTISAIIAHLVLTTGFFWASTLFYKEETDNNKEECDKFFVDVETECFSEEGQDIVDRMQRAKLGTVVMVMGVGLSSMALIPNELWGRLMFLGCALTFLLIGYALKRSAKIEIKIDI